MKTIKFQCPKTCSIAIYSTVFSVNIESFSSLTCMILVTESTIVGGIDRGRFRFRIAEASSSGTRHVQIAVF